MILLYSAFHKTYKFLDDIDKVEDRTFYFRSLEDCESFKFVFQNSGYDVPWEYPIALAKNPNNIPIFQVEDALKDPTQRAIDNLEWAKEALEFIDSFQKEKEKVEEEPKDTEPEKDYDPVEQSWETFRGSGLLWFVNSILHVFGWAIVVQMNSETKEIIRAYPARVRYRGFPENSNTKGYINLSKWMKEHAEELLDEAEDR